MLTLDTIHYILRVASSLDVPNCSAMLSAVSPAVVLPVMLKLQKKGIGVTNGVPTMVIAVAGIDDVLALTAFEVLLGVTFATGTCILQNTC